MSTRSKRILLTGASAGLGLEAASRLARRGHRVWGTSRRRERVPRIPGLHPVALDLGSRDSIEAGVAEAKADAGAPFDVIVNNAGSGRFGPLEHLSDEEVKDQFQILVFGPLHVVRLLLPDLRERRGRIVNVSSLAALYPIPYMGPYSAAKAALSALSWTLQMEVCHEPIQVVDLLPGDLRTAFNERLARSDPEAAEGYRENLRRAFEVYDGNMRQAPAPACAAREIVRLVETVRRPPPQVVVGSGFQARVAPLLFRLVPARWLRWGLRRYYRLTEQER